MIDSHQLRQYVIEPVLSDINAMSESAVQLLLMTAAVESQGGQYVKQLGNGPAMGIYQMEPATHDDIWINFLRYRSDGQMHEIEPYLSKLIHMSSASLAARIAKWQIPGVYDEANAKEMAGNLYYATAMCRALYLRHSEPLPSADDVRGLAEYYKHYYNTALGASDIDRTITAYKRYVRG